MALDIRGGIKNTAINRSEYVVFEEMLSNAIDSYLIRRKEDAQAPKFSVLFEINLIPTSLFNQGLDVDITCTDNGAGFRNEEVKAFITKDSTYKDQLEIIGIGKCKGAGRIQYFHHFNRLSIDSVCEIKGVTLCRTLEINESTREISQESFEEKIDAGAPLLTSVKLSRRRMDSRDVDEGSRIQESFSCNEVRMHLYKSFLQRLIILKDLIGSFSIGVKSVCGGNLEDSHITEADLPRPVEKKLIELVCIHKENPKVQSFINISRYSLPESEFNEFEHVVALCANSAIVRPITKLYLKSAIDRRKAIDGNFELIFVESQAFEEKVNQQRDGFNIPESCAETALLSEDFSLEDVLESLADYVYGIIAPKDFDRESLVRSTEKKFGITREMLEEASIKIHYGDTEESVARRVLKKLQDDIVRDTSGIYKIKEQLLLLDPRTDDFRSKVNQMSWAYTSTIKKMDMTNLSQLIVRRSAMIEVLRHAVSKLLECQQPVSGIRNEHERIIHNIFFPMGKDSIDAKDHDIWLLNEEYQYFNYIASDMPLRTLKWTGGEKIFDEDIDDSLERLFAENNDIHSGKRPDIALFNEEGAAIIIEFKAPDVEIQDHINDLTQYARLLAAKSNGKIKKIFGYLIGNKLNHSRMPTGWTRFANTKGYFHTGVLADPETEKRYGELYSELLFYDQFIDRADLRLGVYKEKLGIKMS
ncbi:hypothetical protein [Xanthomonas arboricola]|uniref:hypothetical protein n=1 Tax=Xanthomonas arboricola TaxID=56448 RepID=UPI000F8ED657|nr:hypothetical protein [Xanthomonas arboricola]